jgi:2-dehydropantoate 2-reductase
MAESSPRGWAPGHDGRVTRIAIVGPGAIGGVLAAWLHATERHEVILCVRRPHDGALDVETPHGPLRATLPVWTEPRGVADWAIVATKAYDADGAGAWLGPLLGAGGPAAIVQNGVEHRARFARWVDAERLVPVVIDLPAERREGRLRQRGPGRMVVEEGARGRDFAALFAGTPLAAETTRDFVTAAWQKLCVNAASVVTGLTMKPNGVLRDDGIAEVARRILHECIAVGRAEGARLEDSLVDEIVTRFREGPPDTVNSLLADRRAGRPTEIDARNGVIVRLGRRHGIATPCNEMAVALIRAT